MSEKNSSNSKIVACPDCEKQVSRRAPTCPYCGCPVKDTMAQNNFEGENNILSPPPFPEDLSLGDFQFGMSNGFSAFIEEGGSTTAAVTPGKKRVTFYANGIKIDPTMFGGSQPESYGIHYSLIINAKYSDRASMVKWLEKEKSVIGRSIAGALICGPIGAVIGGISGIGKKKKKIGYQHYLILNFWELNESYEATPNTLFFCDKGFLIKSIFENFAKEINERKNEWIHRTS